MSACTRTIADHTQPQLRDGTNTTGYHALVSNHILTIRRSIHEAPQGVSSLDDLLASESARQRGLAREYLIDPWGNAYVMEAAPSDSLGVHIYSRGPDGLSHTPDDLTDTNTSGWSTDEGIDEPFDPRRWLFEARPVTATLAALHSGDTDARKSACLAICHINHGCVGHCMHSGRSAPSRETLVHAIQRVEARGPTPRATVLVPPLISALKDPVPSVRENASYSLMDIGPDAREAVTELTARLADASPTVRLWAARALYFITLEPQPTVAASTDLLRHKDPDIACMAAYNLNLMGTDARAAVAELERVIADDAAEDVRAQARQALQAIRE